MPEHRIKVLTINGIRNDGSVDDVRADRLGQFSFANSGSCHVSSFLPAATMQVTHFILDHRGSQQVSLSHILAHDVVLCEIAEPDSHSVALQKAQNLYDAVAGRVRWINDPHRVALTRRDSIPELLSGIDGVIAPKTRKVNIESRQHLTSIIAASGLKLPILMRPTGSHGGVNLVRIDDIAALDQIDQSLYPEAFLTEFVDYGNNGIYAKYRLVVVAGEPLLRHVIYNNHWMVHSESRAFMAEHEELQEREAETIHKFESELKSELSDRIGAIYDRVGLDYFGIDCGIRDGQLILFEVNANMNILVDNQPKPNLWEGQIARINKSIQRRLIFDRIGQDVGRDRG